MKALISGGCKNGKSLFAQRLALDGGRPVYYLATMIPSDREDEARIERHRGERAGLGFETVECGRHILSALERIDPRGSVLLDSVTALLSNEMFDADGFHPDAGRRVAADLTDLVRRVHSIVVVSDQICCDAMPYGEWTEAYRKALAGVDRALAKVCDNVYEVVCGQYICYKGVLP